MLTRSRIRKTDHHKPRSEQKIDRLSSLPPELLDYIFDLAYPLGFPSTGPLSKHLLHYHILGLYRRINVTRQSQVVELSEKLETDPSLGQLIRSAGIDPLHDGSEWPETKGARQFLYQLPNLEELYFGDETDHLFEDVLLEFFGGFIHSDSLRHLTLTGVLDLEPLIRYLPNLESLDFFNYHDNAEHHISFCPCSTPASCDCQEDWEPHENLNELSIHGNSTEGLAPQFTRFLSLFPNLDDLSLKLYQHRPGDPLWQELIPLLSTTLVELSLSGHWSENAPIDHFLPAFTHLRHLHLGTGVFSPNLLSHLSQLHSLETLKLKYGKISLSQLLPLLSGPSRLKSLKSLNLDIIWPGRAGKTMIDEGGKVRQNLVPVDDGKLTSGGWELPKFDDEGGLVTLKETRRLLRRAEKAGIECEGELFEALDVFESYAIEAANVAVYRTHRDRDLRHIDRFKAQHPQLSRFLPPVEFDSLDLTTLSLVKRRSQSEDYFYLSLASDTSSRGLPACDPEAAVRELIQRNHMCLNIFQAN